MSEDEKIKKQIIKNMVLNIIVFSLIFYILGVLIYSQFTQSIYLSADNELLDAINLIKSKQQELSNRFLKNDVAISIITNEQNPRLIYIVRNEKGAVLDEYENLIHFRKAFLNIYFDKNNTNEIYEVSIANTYSYRAISYKLDDERYLQVLINVDAEKVIAERFLKALTITLITGAVLIILASFILSKKSLKPIVISWKRQSKFVQDASHELRTPLAIIQTKQENLLKNPDSQIIDNAEDISITLKETKRLTKLIKELMELAKSDSNQLTLNKEKFNLDEEIQTITKLYKEVAEVQEKKLVLDLNYNENIVADLNKVKELVVILLDNGIKYTEKADEIKVKTYKKDSKCVIEVIDTGIGISKEAQKHVFERFYREEKSRTRESGGMGLGLSIAYNIVKSHKGNIKIDNNIPKGTKVIVRFPIKNS